MVDGNVGISIMEEAAARRYAKEMNIRVVPLAEPWALRELSICVQDLGLLPVFALAMVEALRNSSAWQASAT